MPRHYREFAAEWQTAADKCDIKAITLCTKTSTYYEKTAKALKSPQIGTDMSIQDQDTKLWKKTGIIIGIGRHHDYHVKMPSVWVYWRNLHHLCPYHQCLVSEDHPPATGSHLPARRTDPIVPQLRVRFDQPFGHCARNEQPYPRRSTCVHRAPHRNDARVLFLNSWPSSNFYCSGFACFAFA